MKLLKNILVVLALLAATMPCCHAAEHEAHADVSIAAIPCACHSCDESAHHDDLEMPQELTVSTSGISAPATPILLFVFSETKPLQRPTPSSVVGILASIQTVQLLI